MKLKVEDHSRPTWPQFVVVDEETSTIVSPVFNSGEAASSALEILNNYDPPLQIDDFRAL